MVGSVYRGDWGSTKLALKFLSSADESALLKEARLEIHESMCVAKIKSGKYEVANQFSTCLIVFCYANSWNTRALWRLETCQLTHIFR